MCHVIHFDSLLLNEGHLFLSQTWMRDSESTEKRNIQHLQFMSHDINENSNNYYNKWILTAAIPTVKNIILISNYFKLSFSCFVPLSNFPLCWRAVQIYLFSFRVWNHYLFCSFYCNYNNVSDSLNKLCLHVIENHWSCVTLLLTAVGSQSVMLVALYTTQSNVSYFCVFCSKHIHHAHK